MPHQTLSLSKTPKRSQSQWETRLVAAASLLLLVELLAALGLIGVSAWRGDDYSAVARYAADGLTFYTHRVFGWSPRPVSELVILVYAKLMHLGQLPITIAFMAGMWALFAVATFTAIRQTKWSSASKTLIALSLLVAPIVLAAPAQTFYWPLGSFAYLPTLAGIGFVVLTSLDPESRRLFLIVNGCVLAGVAGSSEIGAMFTLSMSASHLAYAVYRRFKLKAADWRELGCMTATAGFSLLILSMSVLGRVSTDAESGGRGHHLEDSLISSFSSVYLEIVGSGSSAVFHTTAYILLFGGWALCLSVRKQGDELGSSVWLLLISLIVTIFGSAFAGWYQFSSACCERQTTAREYMFLLSALVLSCIIARPLHPVMRQMPAYFGPLAMIFCAVLFGCYTAPEWSAEYQNIGERLAVARENESAGRSLGQAMDYQVLPASRIIEGADLSPGTYNMSSNSPWEAQGIMSYYGKREMSVSSRGWSRH